MKHFVKRLVDLSLSLMALPVAIPVILLMAAAIRVESSGSPLFRQLRIGRSGRPFTIFKLRTMVLNAEHIGAGIYAEADDPRFTRVGRFARRWSFDELPQVINVLQGDMSIVGPRPMLPVTVQEYSDAYATILRVRPGITGLAQVSGRNTLSRSERLVLDARYATTWTNLGDLRILLRTFQVAVSGDGQINSQGVEDVER